MIKGNAAADGKGTSEWRRAWKEKQIGRRAIGCLVGRLLISVCKETLPLSTIPLFPRDFFYLPRANEPLGTDLVATPVKPTCVRRYLHCYIQRDTTVLMSSAPSFRKFRVQRARSKVDDVIVWITRMSYPGVILYLEIPRHRYFRSSNWNSCDR